MSANPNKLSQFWQELKRRRVIHVTIVYASAAFVMIELINNVYEPLKLPEWTPTLIIILLAVGFPIALIFSWIFDVTPEGIQKTPPAFKTPSNKNHNVSSGWKIATYLGVVIILGLMVWNLFRKDPASPGTSDMEKSIAVLPFKNFSTDPGQEVNCFGLTDEIINHLFIIESFDKVASLSSVLTYKDSDKRIPVIAEELDVNYVLEGTYKKIGNQIRVTAQLIEAAEDRHLWQQEYDRPYRYEELLDIQSDIALKIADHIRVYLSSNERDHIQKIPETNQEAYDLLQMAQYVAYSQSSFASTATQSLELAMKAIELAPGYADAYAAAGNFILGRANYGGGQEMRTAGEKALPYLEKALELDPDNGFAHIGMATYYDWYKWDFIKAESEFKRYAELLPGNSIYISQYGEFLIKMGRYEDAAAYLKNPGNFFQFDYRNFRRLLCSGAIREARTAFDQFKNTHHGSGMEKWIGEGYLWLGNDDSALYNFEMALKSEDWEMQQVPRHQANLALTYYHLGDTLRARTIVEKLEVMSRETSAMSPDFFIGLYYSAAGKVDSAFFWLEKAYETRSPEMPWLKVDPMFENLKGDDRYWDLYERVGFKAYDDYLARTSR